MTLALAWIFISAMIYLTATIFVSFFVWYWVMRFVLWILKVL